MYSIKPFYIIALTFSILTSCKTDNKEVFSINQASRPYSELKKLALEEGDTIAYHEMSIEFMDSPNDDGFLLVALTMANKYNHGEAYLDVYYCLTDYYHKADNTELDNLDEKTKKLALDYLKQGAAQGNKECLRLLENIHKTEDLK